MAENHSLSDSKKEMLLNIVSAEASLFSGCVTYLEATAVIGDLGIYPGHTQLLAALKPGQVYYRTAAGVQEVIFVSGGILEVQPAVVTILADTAMRAEDIDEVAAAEVKRRAEEVLSDKENKSDRKEAIHKLEEAVAKLRAIKSLAKHTKR